jgi:hypothetical protein
MLLLDQIKKSPQLMDDFAWSFDFDLARASNDSTWVQLVPQVPFVVVAGESTGGVFLAYGDGAVKERPILYGTSEGQAGRVAASLQEFLAIMMTTPSWSDLLKYSDNGNLAEMRKAALRLEPQFIIDYPDFLNARNRIRSALQIPQISDPIKTLHERIHATDCTLVAKDGWQYESLFGSFTIADTPT